MKPRDIFGLAVRLLGLYFLYLGLRAASLMLDFGAIETASKSDSLNAILPITFNLLVAWWLLGGGLLIRRAYPEAPRIPDHFRPQAERGMPAANSTQSQELTDVGGIEQRLAALVEKPKDGRAA
jgi:hypothetical protein